MQSTSPSTSTTAQGLPSNVIDVPLFEGKKRFVVRITLEGEKGHQLIDKDTISAIRAFAVPFFEQRRLGWIASYTPSDTGLGYAKFVNQELSSPPNQKATLENIRQIYLRVRPIQAMVQITFSPSAAPQNKSADEDSSLPPSIPQSLPTSDTTSDLSQMKIEDITEEETDADEAEDEEIPSLPRLLTPRTSAQVRKDLLGVLSQELENFEKESSDSE